MTLPDDERRLEAAAKALLAASWPGSLSYDKRDPEDQRHCREAIAKAIAAYENEPEPEPPPQLLVDMARAMATVDTLASPDFVPEARAALGVVAKKYLAGSNWINRSECSAAFSNWSGIPQSQVEAMLDE